MNFFQPVRRLTARSREGARVVRYHDEATTPYQRMLQSGALTGARKAVLGKLYLSLNPLRLSRQIEAETEELLRLAWRRGEPPIMVTLPVTAVLRSHPWLGNH